MRSLVVNVGVVSVHGEACVYVSARPISGSRWHGFGCFNVRIDDISSLFLSCCALDLSKRFDTVV